MSEVIEEPMKFWHWRCVVCGVWPKGYEFDCDKGICPSCGAQGPPAVQPLIYVHWQMPCASGPIRDRHGNTYAIACEPKRNFLAASKLPKHHYSATPIIEAVTCPSCMGVPLFKEMMRAVQSLVHPGMRILDGPGCC